ncbi:FAD binding domain-containing protein [Roseomonas rosea]|uniref:FAD binding domain-containing protein n=1 Tax=Muricoccus roseus TaxID=198092 RepID=A0A1M6I067_9PROT|nr:FAD binding domain-containing protein [Roseomonas rosea]
MTAQGWDVVVVGSGLAGLATAIAARLLGLDCLLVEKAAMVGGGTAISSGLLWIGDNHLNAAAGGGDSPEAVRAYLRYVGADGLDPARMEAFAAEAPGALRFFEAAGLPFRLSPRLDHYGMAPGATAGGRPVELPAIDLAELGEWADRVLRPSGPLYRLGGQEAVALGGPNRKATWDAAEEVARANPGLCGAGAGLVAWMLRAALRHGVEIRTGVGAERLVVTDGRVAGIVTRDGETLGRAERRGAGKRRL